MAKNRNQKYVMALGFIYKRDTSLYLCTTLKIAGYFLAYPSDQQLGFYENEHIGVGCRKVLWARMRHLNLEVNMFRTG